MHNAQNTTDNEQLTVKNGRLAARTIQIWTNSICVKLLVS